MPRCRPQSQRHQQVPPTACVAGPYHPHDAGVTQAQIRHHSLNALYRLRKYITLVKRHRGCTYLERSGKSDRLALIGGRGFWVMQNANFPLKNVPRLAGPTKGISDGGQFLGLAGSVALWPRAVRAQPMQVIGFLLTGSGCEHAPGARRVLAGNQRGWFRRSIAISRQATTGLTDTMRRLPILSTDLMRHGASVIVAGGAQAVAAARRATTPTPIVFVAV